jgi:hypothetical protein
MISIGLNIARLIASKKRPALQGLPATAAAYSMRRLLDDYSGKCVNVRRSLDNASTDIGFAYNPATLEHEIDSIALGNFVGYENLLSFSEEFDNAAWTKLRLTVAVNQIANPLNGAVDADKAIPANDSLSNLLHQNYTVTSGVTYTYSMYVKSAGYDFIQLASSTGFALLDYVNFNLSTGTVASNNMSASDYGIESVGDGWYRIHMTQVATSSVSGRFLTLPMSVDVASRAPATTTNGTDGVYVWGGQVNQGATAQTYSPTSRRNLLTFSEEFDNAAWIRVSATVTPNTAIAPNGEMTADTLVSSVGTAAKYLSQYFNSVAGRQYTFSLYAKQDSGRYIQLTPVGGGVFPVTAQTFVNFDLQTGTVSSAGTDFVPADYSINDEGNGWYRISLTATATSSSAVARFLIISLGTGLETRLTSISGTPSYGVFGGQVEESSDPTEYQRVNEAWAATRDGNGFVTTWYDQSGNARNAAQTTAASQPYIVEAGVLNRVNNRPSPLFDGTNSFMNVAAPIALGCVSTVLNSLDGAVFGEYDGIFSGQTTAYFVGLISTDTIYAMNNNGTPRINGVSSNVFAPLVDLKVAATNNIVTAAEPTGWRIGQDRGVTARRWNGNIAEVVAFPGLLSVVDLRIIERNQGIYYGIGVA